MSTTGFLASTLRTHQPFRYRGYVNDVETGLYYLCSRYYNPAWQRFISADLLVQGNVFSYCKNTPVNCSDSLGYDAIWITDTNGLGHSSLLIQDSDGIWYYYYWGAARGSGSSGSSSMSSNAISGIEGNVNVVYEQINLAVGDCGQESILLSLNSQLARNNNKYQYAGEYERATYLTGDFSAAHEQALYNKEHAKELVYDLISMNCAQSVASLLIKSYEATTNTDNIYYLRLKCMWNAFWPIHMHNILDGVDPGEEPMKGY